MESVSSNNPDREGSRGVPIDSPRLGTQSPIFLGTLKGLSVCFKFKKTGFAFSAKKCRVFLDAESAGENSDAHFYAINAETGFFKFKA